ncbi:MULTISPECIES: CinA family protein [unclassified Acinetobacter]|uniref:CinA family protein n=1 Tax=unclassified Acinetobacter TaxID=196816 RepID=UPI00223496D1|nr:MULTISPECIES: CinA family protein [unclassified Acinetobacter]
MAIFFIESASAGYLSYQLLLSYFSENILHESLVCYDLKMKENILNIPHSLLKSIGLNPLKLRKK